MTEAYYTAQQCIAQLEEARIQLERLAAILDHVQQCAVCQLRIETGLGWAVLCDDSFLWDTAKGNSYEQQ